MTKKEKATLITKHAIELLSKNGEFKTIEKIDTKPLGMNIENLSILYTTPFMRIPGLDNLYLLDIWNTSKGKIFSVRWENEINNLEVVNFKRGDWEQDFLDMT